MGAPPRITHPHHARSESHARGGPPPGNPYVHYEEPSPPEMTGGGNYTTDQFEIPSAKRQRLAGPSVTGPASGSFPRTAATHQSLGTSKAGKSGKGPAGGRPIAAPAPADKAKRVRTGCLTCRDRHLKCDEGVPICLNCSKSNRKCSRGIRLSFQEIKVENPPYIPSTEEWSVDFKDESRAIASEYPGGIERYVPVDEPLDTTPLETEAGTTLTHHVQRADAQQTIPSFNDGVGNRDLGRSQNTGMYFFGGGRPGQVDNGGYEESYGQAQDLMSSRRNSQTYLPPGQQAQTIPLQMMQGSGYGNGFTFPRILSQEPVRDEDPRASHSYRPSDVSSDTSSLVPIGAGPASQSFNPAMPPGQPPGGQGGFETPPNGKTTGERDHLSDEEEIYYMQVFINEVAIWMDSFDHQKHFSRIVPYLALKSPMLLNALLACGVKHLQLTDSGFSENKALIYYNTASNILLRSMQNPDRNMVECATTAAVLNVYEIMSESPQARMNHIAGSRALIRECGWNAQSQGIGSACFWLNIGMEVLSCLAFNWQTAWDPDQWGLDISSITGGADGGGGQQRASEPGKGDDDVADSLDRNSYSYNVGGGGSEEAWVHRIFYIVARIANFRANIPRFQAISPHDEQVRLQIRFAEWKRLKAMSDLWNDNCPRPMRPFGYAHGKSSKSLFPNVWLIRRAAVVGRLFYHTAMCLLAQMNPLDPRDSPGNRQAQIHHAHQVCGIVAHTRDHGVASVAIRSMAIASSVLTDADEQKEVLDILDRIHRDTGWRLGTVLAELKKAWDRGGETGSNANVGLAPLGAPPPPGQQQGGGFAAQQGSMVPRPVHPLLAKADFSHPDRPYRAWYKPPNGRNAATSLGFWCP